MPYERALPLSELPVGQHSRVMLSGQQILVANVDGEIHAVSDVCLHRGGSLAGGPLEGDLVTCPLHFWTFNVKSGACVQVPSLVLKVFPTKVENGEVLVEV